MIILHKSNCYQSNQNKHMILISNDNCYQLELKRKKIRKDIQKMNIQSYIKNMNHNRRLIKNKMKD